MANDLNFLTGESSCACDRPPLVNGYSIANGALNSTYEFTWQLPSCYLRRDQPIIQYQIEFVENCSSSTAQQLTSTGNNETEFQVIIPSCTMGNCYVRLRAELDSNRFTQYSPCILVNTHLVEQECKSLFIIPFSDIIVFVVGYIEQYFQDICIPIYGVCRERYDPEFFINGELTLWPEPYDNRFNITWYPSTRSYHFCFTNVTQDITLIEYCYQGHSAGCFLCSAESQQAGELYFLTHSNILLKPSNGNQ